MGKKKLFVRDSDMNELIKKIEHLGMRHGVGKVFSDFVAFCAYAISNPVDGIHREEQETAYLSIAKSYTKAEMNLFSECFADLVMLADTYAKDVGPRDILGKVMESLGLTSDSTGQFFTPEEVSIFMAKILMGNPEEAISEKGYITINEPCSGSGRMLLAAAEVLNENKINYCSQMCVLAEDVDLRCAQMTYVQLSLYGIPAVVKHKDTLSMKTWSVWYTPVYMLNKWFWREGFVETEEEQQTNQLFRLASEPLYAAMCSIMAQEKKECMIEMEQNKMYEFHFDFDLSNLKQTTRQVV